MVTKQNISFTHLFSIEILRFRSLIHNSIDQASHTKTSSILQKDDDELSETMSDKRKVNKKTAWRG